MSSVESFIAWRYLKTKRKIRFINVIGVISIGGIAVGVAALLIALSVFNGFNGVVTAVLVGFDPHLRIERRGGMPSADYGSIAHTLEAEKDIRAFSPFVSGKAMLTAQSFNQVVFVRGVDQAKIGDVSGLKRSVVLGSLVFKDTSGVPGVILGLALADRLASVVGSDIMIYSPYGIESAVAGMGAPQGTKFRVTAVFESNNRDYDANYAYVSVEAAQDMFRMSGKYSGVEMRLTDFSLADRVKSDLEAKIPAGYTVSTWYDLHQNLYAVMKIERWSAYVLLSLIILVATFNMLGSLTMSVVEKQRDIAALKSMGMEARRIVRVFLVEGIMIGVIGTVIGVAIGLVVLYLQLKYQIFPLDTTVYIIPAIPVEIRWTDFVAISFASLGMSFLAAYYPARRAAAVMPAEALRWE